MVESNPTGSPLEGTAGAAGPRATDAFSILGHETRLAILLALWDAYEPWDAETTVPFSELRERVGRPDSGQFNYHLEKLTGQFIRRTEEGYELRRAGHRLVRTIIAGAGIEDPVIDRTDIDRTGVERVCPLCGAPTAITYRDEVLFWVCTGCDGRFGTRDGVPAGTLAGADLDPAGFTDRSPDALLEAAFVRGALGLRSALEGVCEACSGPMEGRLVACEDHATEGMCPTCERRSAVMARFLCPVCKNHQEYVPSCSWLLMDHPGVVAFCHDHAVPLRSGGDVSRGFPREDTTPLRPRYRALDPEEEIGHEIVSTDPPRVRVRVRREGAELALTLEEDLTVSDVTERA